jgi:phosphoglycolate phosphatase-like HAD superfamily hydrolase
MAGYSERANAPTMTREVQHWIGKELRDMYAELLRQPLPESLVASLRARELKSQDHAGDEAPPDRLLPQVKVQ